MREAAQISNLQSSGECLTLETVVSFSSKCRSLLRRPTARAGSSAFDVTSLSAAETFERPRRAICSIRPWLQLSAAVFSRPTLQTSLHTEEATEEKSDVRRGVSVCFTEGRAAYTVLDSKREQQNRVDL